MPASTKAAVTSFLTSALAVLGFLAAVSLLDAPVNIPGAWIAWLTFGIAVVRTALAWVNPTMTLFGVGSGKA
jgi:hypothetical protein